MDMTDLGPHIDVDPHLPDCRFCGYNLDGLPADTGICPECGAPYIRGSRPPKPETELHSWSVRHDPVLLLAATSLVCGGATAIMCIGFDGRMALAGVAGVISGEAAAFLYRRKPTDSVGPELTLLGRLLSWVGLGCFTLTMICFAVVALWR